MAEPRDNELTETNMSMQRPLNILVALLLAGCQLPGGTGQGVPVAPSGDASGWSLSVERLWSAVGDGLTPAHETLRVEVSGSGTGLPLLLWVDGEWSWQLPSSSGQQSFELPLADLPLMSKNPACTTGEKHEIVACIRAANNIILGVCYLWCMSHRRISLTTTTFDYHHL